MAKRPYEISLWSHNDRFLSVLTSSDAASLGSAYEPHWYDGINGEKKLTFTIPIKYFDPQTKEFVNNEKWYNELKQSHSLANEKKVKLIFDKLKTDSISGYYIHDIYEFIIEELVEERNGNELLCKVTCLSAAFKELGKTGTELTLSFDTMALEAEKTQAQLKPTISYWLDKVFPSQTYTFMPQWTYRVNVSNSMNMPNTKIYEESPVDSWVKIGDVLEPVFAPAPIEKERFIDVKQSNKYNITQDLAEAFQVFVDYKYYYEDPDQPFKITKKEVIFYDAPQNSGEYSIVYGNNELGLSKTSSSTDVTTKMFVEDIQSEYSDSGFVSISNAQGNKVKDNFILNFDYFIQSGQLSESQIALIAPFESAIRDANEEIATYANAVINLEHEITLLKADVSNYQNAVNSANDNVIEIEDKLLGFAQELPSQIVQDKDVLNTVKLNGAVLSLDLRRKGVLAQGLTVATLTNTPVNITSSNFILDNYGYVITIVFPPALGIADGTTVKLNYNYDLLSFYRNERETYLTIKTSASGKLAQKQTLLNTANQQKSDKEALLEAALEAKKIIVDTFNQKMAPFLKEGTWSEDNYQPSFEMHSLNSVPLTYDPYAISGEPKSWYMEGLTKKYYDYIILPDGISASSIEQLVITESFTQSGVPIIRELRYGAQYVPHFIYTKEVFENPYQTLAALVSANPSNTLAYFVKENGLVYHKPSTSWVPLLPIVALVLDSNIHVREAGHTFAISGTAIPLQKRITGSAYSIAQRRWFLTQDGQPASAQLLNFQTSTLILRRSGMLLEEFDDYNITHNDTVKSITIKINNKATYDTVQFNADYKLDVSSEQLLRDAQSVSKTSAVPQVSYEVTFAYLNEAVAGMSLTDTNLNKKIEVGSIVRITDYDLQIRNVKGIVSSVDRNLDRPEETVFTIQNYRTKFEDLFERIIASSEQMKSNGYIYNRIANAFTPNMTLSGSILQQSLNDANLVMNFGVGSGVSISNYGLLTETSKPYPNGVTGQTLITGGQILLSNSLNQDGGRFWSTAISPNGINAGLITSGRINTELVNIYSGDQIRFTWKADGIFAYKSKANGYSDFDNYVKYNEDGLRLIKKVEGNEISRVEVSWDGFILRNDDNIDVFYADPDTGNLNITGYIHAMGGIIDESMTVGGSLGSPLFANGALGTGWRIDGDGSAEFNNVYVRGTISASVFEYDKISSVGGSLYIAPTLVTMSSAPVTVDLVSNKYRFSINHGFSTTGTQTNWSAGRNWLINDIVSLQGYIIKYIYNEASHQYEPDAYELKDVRSKIVAFLKQDGTPTTNNSEIPNGAYGIILETIETIDAINNRQEYMQWRNEGEEQYSYSSPMPDGEGLQDKLESDAKLIYWGTASASGTLRKGIYMTAALDDSPFIDIYDQETVASLPQVRLGNLQGITDPRFGPNPLGGYGLYSENAYLIGAINAQSGSIGIATNKWLIGSDATNASIYNGKSTLNTIGSGIYLGADGIALGDTFKVLRDGTFNFGDGAITYNNSLLAITANSINIASGGKLNLASPNDLIISSGTSISQYVTNATDGAKIYYGSSAPANPFVGMMWLNSIDKLLRRCTATSPLTWLVVQANEIHTSYIDIGQQGIDIKSNGYVDIESGRLSIVGSEVSIDADSTFNLEAGVGETGMGLSNARSDGYVLFAGNTDPTLAEFSVKNDGSIIASKILISNDNISYVDAAKLTTGTLNVDRIATGSLDAGKITAHTITADQIGVGSLTADTIQANAITAEKIEALAITTDKLAANSITTEKISAGAVTADTIAADAITTDKLAAGAVTALKIGAGEITTDHIAANAITAEQINAGAITTEKLDANAVTTAKLDAGAVTTSILHADAVTSDKIFAGAVTTDKLFAGAVTAEKIGAGEITAEKVYSGEVNTLKLTSDHIQTHSLTAASIDANTITADELAVDSVTSDKIAADSITAEKILAGEITASKLYAGEVDADKITADHIKSGSLTTATIQAGAITSDKIYSAEVDSLRIQSDNIGAKVITSEKIAANSITADQIASGAVTTEKIYAGAVDANAIQAGAIGAQHIAGESIKGEHLYAGISDADKITAKHIASNSLTGEVIQSGTITADLLYAGDADIKKIKAENIQTGSLTADVLYSGEAEIYKIKANNIAAESIEGRNIKAETITADNIGAEAITAGKIAAGAVTSDTIEAGAVTAGKIAAGSITANDIAVGAITADRLVTAEGAIGKLTSDNIQAGSITSDSIATGTITADKLVTAEGAIGKLTADNIQAGSITAAVMATGTITADSAIIADGAITNAKIEDAAITNAKIKDGEIYAAKIHDGEITNAKIANGAITNAKIDTLAVDTANIVDGAITNAKIDDLAVTNAKIADASIESAKIKDLSADKLTAGTIDASIIDVTNLNASHITSGSLLADYIGAGQINAGHIGTNEIIADSANIKDGIITNLKVADGAITSLKVAEGAITTAHIGKAQITTAHIADAGIDFASIANVVIGQGMIGNEAVGTAQIADGSITDAKIVELTANKITAGELSVERLIISGSEQSILFAINNIGDLVSTEFNTLDGDTLTPRSITADKIVAESITSEEIAANTITANNILSNTITGDKLTANAITAREILAGSITANKLASDVGASLDLSSNTGINLTIAGINTAIEGKADASALDGLVSDETLNDRFTTELEIVNGSITSKFTEAKEAGTAAADALGEFKTTVESWQQFSPAGLTLGRSDSKYKIVLSNEKLQFLENDIEIAYITGSKLYITASEVVSQFVIGGPTEGYTTLDVMDGGLTGTWRNT